jgi:transcriptional regulator with XRE-family HTH domain/Zn-dependent peptidase ImmA (M78 family)
MRLASILKDARARAQLSARLMSDMLGVDEHRVQQFEAGEDEPTPGELDTYARVFGVRMEDLVEGRAADAPLTSLFFRFATEGGEAALQELVNSGGHLAIGEFMRCVRDIAELEARLERPGPAPLPAPPQSILKELSAPPPHGADRLADWLRSELGLGLGLDPIPSMIDLLEEKLHVRLIWATPDGDELPTDIDGASTSSPRPAILVNLIEGPDCWWRTRMTLGHELCHLLCDQDPGNRRFAMFSPQARRGHAAEWHLFQDFERIERRASAFAVCLLAPENAVKQAVGTLDPTSEDAVALVGKTFGLGRTTAINRLQQVFRFRKEMRAAMIGRNRRSWRQWKHPDQVSASVGMRSGAVADLALEALAQDRIDEIDARSYLNLLLTDSLPEYPGLNDEQRAPLRHPHDWVRGVAQHYLQGVEHGSLECYAGDVAPAEDGWRVEIVKRSGNDLVPCGHLLVSYDMDIRAAHIEAGAFPTA